MMRGKLIVFEGGEGAGKTSQIAALKTWLQTSGALEMLQASGDVSQLIVTREPGGTQLGKQLRQWLLSASEIADRAELLLYAADRAQHVQEVLHPHLSAGSLVLCDRYTDSTMAYQGYGRGIDRDWISQLNQIATAGLQSDLTLWLDVEIEVGLQRVQQRGTPDRMEQAKFQFHQRVRQGFMALAEAYPQRIVRVDANQTAADVAQAIQSIVRSRLTQWYSLPSLP